VVAAFCWTGGAGRWRDDVREDEPQRTYVESERCRVWYCVVRDGELSKSIV
jgi:hypothetical protein